MMPRAGRSPEEEFATVGPAAGGRLEVASGMCTHRIRMGAPDELDDEVRAWMREAYERA